MVSKNQLQLVGENCPGYVNNNNASGINSSITDESVVSCETCIHWDKGKCNIDLFDKVVSDLDQT
ncbi:MAG: hypothetical protein PWQ97_1268 [Tepidanaerobacteraceae bacterium]|nr:hypothetical protein [Tepidanaerobacteraceae bacterium]